MTRDELKGLIRECLIEIITEGAGQMPAPRERVRESARAAQHQTQDVPRRKTIGGMSLDRPAAPRATQALPPQPQRRVQETASRVASKITNDPVLSSIFADTAATTLQEQINAERAGPGVADPFVAVTSQREVSEMFGDAAQNWAALAFSGGAS
jgi:hypothetical protein